MTMTLRFNNTYAALPETFYSKQNPAPAPNPQMICANHELAAELGIDPDFLTSEAGLAMCSGRAMPNGAQPIAMAYAGHQFGGWSPQLGDGRALLIGEITSPAGERFDIQLKGSGRTRFSRQGDGKAALGPVLREYIVSEAMAALGVPTTRALAAVTTGERVQRERGLPGAIITRVARSHVRIGTFQYFAAREDVASLRTLTDYVIARHYPEAAAAPNPALAMFQAIAARQARLVASWMKYGFIHGVMNTDNMQVAGETIDYGPCAFMDDFDPLKTFSSIDFHGRYAWGRQPSIAQWNLARLGEALLPLWNEPEDAAISRIQDALSEYAGAFNTAFVSAFAQKLGLLPDWEPCQTFIQATLKTMHENRTDFTLFFSRLARLQESGGRDRFHALFASPEAAASWLEEWERACKDCDMDPDSRQSLMRSANPIYIARNHQVEYAIAAALNGDYTPMLKLHGILRHPFKEQPDASAYERPPQPDEAVLQTFCGT